MTCDSRPISGSWALQYLSRGSGKPVSGDTRDFCLRERNRAVASSEYFVVPSALTACLDAGSESSENSNACDVLSRLTHVAGVGVGIRPRVGQYAGMIGCDDKCRQQW